MNALAFAPINGPTMADPEQRMADLEVRLAAALDANAMTALLFDGKLGKLSAAFTIADLYRVYFVPAIAAASNAAV